VAARLSFLALMLYLAADFANPLMPGAVCFDPDDTVDAVGCVRSPVTPSPLPPLHAHAVPVAPETTRDIRPRSTRRDRRAVRAAPRARAVLSVVPESSSDPA
jgi:hypothetical protein